MTDLPPPIPTSPAPPPIKPPIKPVGTGASRGTRIVLALSLAANLAVAGFVLGHKLDRDGPGPGNMARDLAFGPFTEALSDGDRRALAKTLYAKAPGMRDARKSMEADISAILTSLLADPFDPSALDAAFAAQNLRASENLRVAQTALREFLVGMTPQDRIAFANRLQKRMDRDHKD